MLVATVEFDTNAFVQDLNATLERMDSRGHNAFHGELQQAVEFQREHGYQNRTGRLTASMGFRENRSGLLKWTGYTFAKAPYALFVDQPTKPHDIVARRAKLLRFFWPKIGGWFVGKKVRHPGTDGAHFTDAAAFVFGARTPAAVESAIASAVQ